MNAWRPIQYRAPTGRPHMGQPSVAYRPPTTATGIGGILLLSGVLTNMLVSTDQRPVAQAVRVLVAGFAAYLVGTESFRAVASGEGEEIAGPALGLAALVAALTGAGYLIFRRPGQ